MKKIYLLAALTLALTACDSNDDNISPATSSQVPLRVFASIGESVTSRATIDNSWAEGDQIGITVTVGSVQPHINVPYTCTTTGGGSETTGDGSEFKGSPLFFYWPMKVTAYYPYAEGTEGNLAPGTDGDGIITATTDAEHQIAKNQPSIDFLYAVGNTTIIKDDTKGDYPLVRFNFAHKMSKVTFTFQDSPEITDNETGIVLAGPVHVSDIINYTINGLVLDGTFDTNNTNNGVCAVKTDVSATSLSIDVKDVKDNEPVPPVIIFPQTLSEGYAVLNITTDELKTGKPETYQHYKCNLSFSNGEILPGYHYQYTIKVSKIGLIVGKMTVEPWKVENRYMTATIDGDVFKND